MTPAGRQLLTVLPSIMLPMFLAVVDQTIVATALPAIAAELGSVERISWIVVSYLVATTIAAPVYGQLRDVYNGKRMMFVALGIFIPASLLCASATSVEMLTAGRILQGLGGGGLMTLSQALIGETVPPRERARYQGYLAAVMVTSSTFGPVAGGYLTEHFGWRSVFLINLPVGLLAVLLTLRLEPRPARDQPWTFDMIGLLLLASFIAPVLLALDQAQRMRAGALPLVLVLLGMGLAALAMLVRQERRAAFPLLPVALLRDPTIWRSNALAACHGAALVSLLTLLPIYLHVVRASSSSQTGLILLPLMFGIGTGSMVTGRIISRTGLTMVFPSVGLVLAAGALATLAFAIAGLSGPGIGAFLFGLGLCMGTVMGVVQITVQNAAGPHRLGAAAASVQLSRSLGAAAGTALIGAVLFAALALGDPQTASLFGRIIARSAPVEGALSPLQHGTAGTEIALAFRASFSMIAAFAAIGAVLAWTIPARRL